MLLRACYAQVADLFCFVVHVSVFFVDLEVLGFTSDDFGNRAIFDDDVLQISATQNGPLSKRVFGVFGRALGGRGYRTNQCIYVYIPIYNIYIYIP